MKLPRAVARFNKRVNNPIQSNWAWLLPPWAIVIHRGRKSGRDYRTPVLAFVQGDQLVIHVLYGTESDWVRNLLAAGGGEVVRLGHTYRLDNPRLLDVDALGGEALSPLVRLASRVSGHVLIARLGAAVAGRTRRGLPASA